MTVPKIIGNPITVLLLDENQKPVPGVVVRIKNRYAYTNMEGEALFLALAPGDYELSVDAADYLPLRKNISILNTINNESCVLASLKTGSFQGTIKHAFSNLPLHGVQVRLWSDIQPTLMTECILFSDWNGFFEGRVIPCGDYKYEISGSNYVTQEGSCKIKEEKYNLDIQLQHQPKFVKLQVEIKTEDERPIDKSKLRIFEGMGNFTVIEAHGVNSYSLDNIDIAPFNHYLVQDSKTISPLSVLAVEIPDYHTEYQILDFRSSHELTVNLTCRKRHQGKEIVYSSITEPPAQIPLNEPIDIQIQGNRQERMLRSSLTYSGIVTATAGPAPYNTSIKILDKELRVLAEGSGSANYPVSITAHAMAGEINFVISGDIPEVPNITCPFMVNHTPVIDPYEPNDTFESAVIVNQGEIIRSFIYPLNDPSYYAVEVQSPSQLRVRLTDSNINTLVRIINPDGQELVNKWDYAKVPIDISCNVYEQGLYRIAVEAQDPSALAIANFSLRIDLLSCNTDRPDYSDEFVEFVPIPVNAWISNQLFPAGKICLYQFSTDITGFLRIHFYLPACNAQLTVKNDKGDILYQNWEYENKQIFIDIPLAETGDYYIEIRGTDAQTNSLKSFFIALYFYPNDEYEGFGGNNSLESAAQIHLGQTVSAALLVPGDMDTYRFYANQPGLLSLDTGTFPFNQYYRIFDSAGNKLFENWDYAGKTWHQEVHLRQPGYYFLQTWQSDGNAFSNIAYHFILHLNRITPPSSTDDELILLPIDHGEVLDALLPGQIYNCSIPVPVAETIKLGARIPYNTKLIISDASGKEIYNNWEYGERDYIVPVTLDAPTTLKMMVQATDQNSWSKNNFFVFACIDSLPPEPRLLVERINMDERKVIFNTTATSYTGQSIQKMEIDYAGDGNFSEIASGLVEHIYADNSIYQPVLRVTDDRNATGIHRIFLDLLQADLTQVSCRIFEPRYGDSISAPMKIKALAGGGLGKAITMMALFMDGKRIAQTSSSSIEIDFDWKTLYGDQHIIMVKAYGGGDKTAEHTIQIQVNNCYDLWPHNGMLLTGSRATIIWYSSSAEKGWVEYRKDGEENWTAVTGATSQEHRIVLDNLEFGIPYQFRAGNKQVFSEIRTFTLLKGLAFESFKYGASISRDYNQTMPVTILNHSDQDMQVIVECLLPANGELLASFIGEGSQDRPITLQAGATRQIMLALSAQDCLIELHRFMIGIRSDTGYSDQAEVEIRVKLPVVNLVWEELETHPNTLSKKLRLSNKGDTLTDLCIQAEPVDTFQLRPAADHYLLKSNESIDIWADPLMYEGFQEISGEIIASSLGKTSSYSIKYKVPEGQNTFLVTVDPPYWQQILSWYCTNRPYVPMLAAVLDYLSSTSGIKASVGKKDKNGKAQKNLPDDVKLIQKMLNFHILYNPKFQAHINKTFPVDGICTDDLIKAMELFQKFIVGMNKADGIIDPNGKTWKALMLTGTSKNKPVTQANSTEISGSAISEADLGSFKINISGLSKDFINSHYQLSDLYKDDKLGSSNTSFKKGCRLFCFTAAFAMLTGSCEYGPRAINEYLNTQQCFKGADMDCPRAASVLGIDYQVKSAASDEQAFGVIDNALSKGYLVMALRGKHSFLITAQQNGCYDVLDSGRRKLVFTIQKNSDGVYQLFNQQGIEIPKLNINEKSIRILRPLKPEKYSEGLKCFLKTSP